MLAKKQQYRTKMLRLLGPLAQLAFVAAIVLGRLENPSLDFTVGALTGFALVGNLAFLFSLRRLRA